MAATKLIRKLISSVVKKKKKGKSSKLDEAIEFAKETGFLGRHNEPRLKQIISKNKLVDILNDPAERKKITAAVGKRKKPTTQEKAPSKKTKAKPMGTAAKTAAGKKALKKIPKKSDKRIEGSGSQSARPKGSIGKTRTADSPRGGTTGMKMSEARKKQMRDTANLDSEMKRLGRKYDDLPKGVKRTILMAIRSKDPAKIKKAMRGTNMTASEFVKVFNKRGKM